MPENVRGFGLLPCPLCGATTCIAVDLDDLDTFHCSQCGDEFDTERVSDFMSKWTPVLHWIGNANYPK